MPDLNVEYYKRVINAKKKEIEARAEKVLASLSSASDPGQQHVFKQACDDLHQSIREASQLFDPNSPSSTLSRLNEVVIGMERNPKQVPYILEFADLMRRVPNIPFDRPALEDDVKKLAD